MIIFICCPRTLLTAGTLNHSCLPSSDRVLTLGGKLVAIKSWLHTHEVADIDPNCELLPVTV